MLSFLKKLFPGHDRPSIPPEFRVRNVSGYTIYDARDVEDADLVLDRLEKRGFKVFRSTLTVVGDATTIRRAVLEDRRNSE